MRAAIRDATALSALRPLEIMAYLRSSGWKNVAEQPNHSSTWLYKDAAGEEFEIAVPLNHTFRDFAQRMSDVLSTLEAVEQRSQLEILHDLVVTSADVVRVRLIDRDVADGSVPIEDGAQFFQKAKDMMLAAACAAAELRAYYPSKKPIQAMKYLQKTRLGQTEQGSFVLTIISRVVPSLAGSDGQLFELEEPFERKVTLTLANALAAVRAAAENAASTGTLDSFIASVRKGVSANLCDALVGMAGGRDSRRDLAIDFTWSRSRPLTTDSTTPAKTLLSADALPMIEEASRYFKGTSPREEFELRGFVVKLERTENAPTGRVTVLTFFDDKPRKVTAELPEADYHKAVTAHDRQQTVVCFGTLVRDGRSFRLRDPHDFSVTFDD
jgi:hypothetical protein